MMKREIQLHIHALAQLLTKKKSDFPTFRDFNFYKKEQIHAYRNQLLAKQLNCDKNTLIFSKHEHGKPFLSSHNLHFNHSHSHEYYALVMSQQVKDIGVDVEELGRKIRFDAFAQHAFHADEYKTWQQQGQDREYWFKVWTTKEAILKASGLGIRLDLNSLNTNVHPEQNGGMCTHPMIGTFAYQNFILNQNIVVTVAWRAEPSCRGFQFPQIKIKHD
ncbi:MULTISPECIES: 4'-phosphopantetheinyl transferase superfamily protein [Acinetobacter]|uniref:4'-phosphopantetheinyl transferase family protein n=1 Tax=Acinetobacter TaxID=469 RepID=UPI000C66D6A6|nr:MULTISPECIES: 4'-phosphopantetheinyl transferase superfamily protein [Acinetobacter]MBC67578.1 ACP synthase [Acinetobacter sp.]MBT49060.1 ACP synthase [Acinetobacter sp.]HIQ35984.1 4'-phosphopantetheinyl transferase superfamily protein [Acinetobacter venetianus]HJP47136.1 4'-phosphopantetheinyl transferase superfamily protein [Acinetobacter venetianus]|tara:strand:- start:1346 stop:1999 length:654 start_codon:yes stop_codon:yes gene_type:complete